MDDNTDMITIPKKIKLSNYRKITKYTTLETLTQGPKINKL